MGTPASGVDFDHNRLSPGEFIAGVAGVVLLIDLWFKWYGVKVSGAGALSGFSIGVSATAWEVFSLIDIILFLVSLIAIGVAVLKALDRLPEMPYPPGSLITVAGGIAVVLILFRIIDTPGGDLPNNVDITRKFGVWLGLLSAAAVAYGGWRATQDAGAGFGAGGGAAAGGAASPPAPTTPMPPAGADPGVPGGGAAGVSPGKEGPGAPNPGTSTGGPGDGDVTPPPAAAGADPVPGETGSQTPPGLAGDPPPAGEGTQPPGL